MLVLHLDPRCPFFRVDESLKKLEQDNCFVGSYRKLDIRLNCTLVTKSLRHTLPSLLLNIDVEALIARLLARLRRPGAKELTRADRQAPRPRHDRVRLAGFYLAYKSA